MRTYSRFSWHQAKEFTDDGMYLGFYNAEHAIFRIENNQPVLVQFIDNSRIYEAKGVLLSSVELLVETYDNSIL